MKNKNFILVSLDDPRAKKIAEVMGGVTSKKILDYLAEHSGSSEKDLSTALKIPLNTIGYNMKKLLEAELIDKTSKFFWSVKGKKIPLYKVSNKSIVISPKNSNFASQLKTILPVSLIAAFGSLVIRLSHSSAQVASNIAAPMQEKAADVAYGSAEVFSNAQIPEAITTATSLGSPAWWFIGGFVLSVAVFTIVKNIMKFTKINERRLK